MNSIAPTPTNPPTQIQSIREMRTVARNSRFVSPFAPFIRYNGRQLQKTMLFVRIARWSLASQAHPWILRFA
jgi:hypothetical protein